MLTNLENMNWLWAILSVWELTWKGIALWLSSKRNQKYWFIAIFLINSFGILPIFYLWKTKQLRQIITKNFWKI